LVNVSNRKIPKLEYLVIYRIRLKL
jgi:hypothetical protein